MGTNHANLKQPIARLFVAIAIATCGTAGPHEAIADDFRMLISNHDPLADEDPQGDAQDAAAPQEEVDTLAIQSDTEPGQSGEESADDLVREIQSRVEIFPQVEQGRFSMPPLVAMTTATEQIGNGRTPESFREKEPANLVPLLESADQRGEAWNWSVAQWEAPNTFSYPLYFEDRMLERHGHDRWGHFQPVASGVRFFTTVPMLPYLMTVSAPCDCEYKLGHYRSGSRAPVMIQRPPLERRAVIAEAVWLGGALAIFP